MRNYKINKSKILKVLLLIIVLLSLHGCSTESRGFGTPCVAGFTYEQDEKGEKGEKIKKDIISNVQMSEFYCGILSGTCGSFFIENNSVSFTILKLNLKDRKANLRDEKNHLYKGTAKYKNKKYNLDIIIKWHGFGATIVGTLYDKSNKNQIKFEIN